MKRIKNILITNAIALNGGDAAILHATIRILKAQFGDGVTITVHDMAARASRYYYPAITFRSDIYSEAVAWARGRVRPAIAAIAVLAVAVLMRIAPENRLTARLPPSLRATLDDYLKADVVVSSGGTYLVPHYALASKLLDFLTAHLLGKPLVLFTQSLGPFKSIKHRALLRYVLRRAALILVRDERSRSYLDELGVPPARVQLCADAAFALARDDLPRGHFPPPHQNWRIAISVRDWPHFQGGAQNGMERYFTSLAALVFELTGRWGAKVTFISTCQGTPEYWTDDSRTAELIVERLPQALRERVTIDRKFRAPGQLIADLATYDLTIATRLHAAILSLCAGTPVLPISYEFKTTELFRRFGLGEATIDVEGISPHAILAAFDAASAFWSTQSEEAWSKTAAAQRSAFDAGKFIARALEGKVSDPLPRASGNAFQGRD